MLGRICARIVTFFLRHSVLFYLLLFLFVAISVNGLRRIHITSNIYDIFPSGKDYADFSAIMNENSFTKQVVFSIQAQESPDSSLAMMESVVQIFQSRGDYFKDFTIQRTIDQGALINYLQRAMITGVDSLDYQSFSQTYGSKDSIQKQLKRIKEDLSGAKGFFYASYYSQDPFAFSSKGLAAVADNSKSPNYIVEDGLVYSADYKRLFFFAELNCAQGQSSCSKDANALLQSVQNEFNSSYSNAHLEGFGTFQIAVENEQQIQKDTILTVSISVALILFILFLFYRKASIPLIFMIPCFFGILFGLGFVGYFQPHINGISIATASVLLGIVLDYSFHFFTHLKHSKSIINTVKDISFPMLVGSFTTVGAFASLMFTNSAILQNFGLIALVTLLGAALFTIIGLPVILTTLKFSFPEEQTAERNTPRWIPKILTLIIALGSLFFLVQNEQMRFDGDINNLAYHPTYLQEKETEFTGITPTKQKKVYLFSKGKTMEEAQVVNRQLAEVLKEKKEEYTIAEMVSTAPYLIPEVEWSQKYAEWQTFWAHNNSVLDDFREESEKLGFTDAAFNPFYDFIADKGEVVAEGSEFVTQLGMNNLVHNGNGQNSIITILVLDKEHLSALKEEIKINLGSDVFVMDISDLSAQFLVSLKDDFNYLLFFSSALVFFSLLVIYGRLELSLFAFAPMALSWLWILSGGYYLGLEFNFVNILIVTFIFGLGDDYSIFVTDGLLNKSRYGTNQLASYKQAIILSGITTIIGTGILVLAKHPAIQSVGGLSILGIGLIMIMTLAVQPYVFNYLVIRRKEKGLGPITIVNFIFSILLFSYFFIFCFLSFVLLLFLLVLPIKKMKKQYILNYTIYLVAKSIINCYPRVRYLEIDRFNYKDGIGKIVIANHSSFIDILAMLSISPKAVILVKDWVYNSPVFGPCIRYAGYLYVGDGSEKNLERVREKLANGYSVIIFPEGTRSADGQIGRFHKGAFHLAKSLNCPIQPVVLIGLNWVNPKNDIMINPGYFYMKYLPVIDPTEFGSYQEITKCAQSQMRLNLQQGLIEQTSTQFWKQAILRNYLLKGPVLEWYVRIKYKLEASNFIYYNQLIGSRSRIYDLGAGLGYLDFLLHYANIERQITAIDADEEKILTAANGIYDVRRLNFVCQDILKYNYEAADVFIINDVLHYLPKLEQEQLLSKLVDLLNPNGIIILRDGVAGIASTKNTKRSEVWSTKIIGFNKVANQMEFLSKEELFVFAKKHSLILEDQSHSKVTSNHLFVFRKDEFTV